MSSPSISSPVCVRLRPNPLFSPVSEKYDNNKLLPLRLGPEVTLLFSSAAGPLCAARIPLSEHIHTLRPPPSRHTPTGEILIIISESYDWICSHGESRGEMEWWMCGSISFADAISLSGDYGVILAPKYGLICRGFLICSVSEFSEFPRNYRSMCLHRQDV